MLKCIFAFLLIFSEQNASAQTDSVVYYRHKWLQETLKCDTLTHQKYILNKKLNKLVFYENLVIKHSEYIKFLKGWQRRTLEN